MRLFHSFLGYIESNVTRTRKRVKKRIALLWQYSYLIEYRLYKWKLRHGSVVFSAVLILLVFVSLYLSPALQDVLKKHYATDEAIERLSGLILNLGTALIGAAAIVTSLVLFAMQVNIERMPYGLFRRLNADWKLLGAFASTFLLAIGVATLSTVTNKNQLAVVVLATSWSVIVILGLFMYAYRRALILINPLQQLGILIRDTRKELRSRARQALRVMPLLEREESASTTSSPIDSTHDLPRTAYYQINNHWTDSAKRAVQHAMSFAQRYAEQGDHEVSEAALNAVLQINVAYIQAKGKTFYANTLLVDNPLVHDSFINDTLEHLRQDIQTGIARRDEQQIKQTLRAMAALVQVYLGIDYSDPCTTKSHAHLAAGYLAKAVQDVVPHNLADVLLEGQRLIGRSAQYFLAHGSPNDIATLSEQIALLACTGCTNKDYRPVTMEGMTQLSKLTFDLLLTKNHDIHFAAKRVRQDVALITKLFLNNVADTPLLSSHSTVLGPYYSSISTQSLRIQMLRLANALLEAIPDDANAKSVIWNIQHWADGLYHTEKELLLSAIRVRSHFTSDMLHWITGITEILLAVADAPACDHHSQNQLREHASYLIATLTWIPDDKDTVTFVENFQMTEILFKAAVDARNRDCDQVAKEIWENLLSWTLKAGRHQIGFSILERGLYALAAFALMDGDAGVSGLKAVIATRLSDESATPEQGIRGQAAREILERAANLHRKGHLTSHIDMAISQADHQKLRPLLEEIAGLLSPSNANLV